MTIHVGAGYTPESQANKDQANGYAALDAARRLAAARLPVEALQASSQPAKAPGTLWVINPCDAFYGADPTGNTPSAAAINLAISWASTYRASGQGSAVIALPNGTFLLENALLMKFGVKLWGASAYGTTLKASPTGNFTNGSRSSFKALVKWDGGDSWSHGVNLIDLKLDPNGVPGLSGYWMQDAGELFLLDRIQCSSTVATSRTITDAQLTAGSNLVTLTASTVTEDDVNAVLQFGGTVAAPAAPTLTPTIPPPPEAVLSSSATGGTIPAGDYYAAITYVTALGESAPSPIHGLGSGTSAILTTGATSTITCASPPAASGATGWRLYMSPMGGGAFEYLQGGTNAIGTAKTLTAPPVTNTATPPAAPAIAAGTYSVGITYLTANGETPLSALTNVTVAANQSFTISSPPALAGATGWFAYVSQSGGAWEVWRQQAAGSATAIGTNLLITAPVRGTASPYKKIDRPNWGANDSSTTKTSFYMNSPAAATLANVTVTIQSPTDAIVVGGGVAGRIGTINGVKNSGALLRIKGGDTWLIDELSGDDNMGGMLRISGVGQGGDPAHITVQQLKVESDPQYTSMDISGYAHDPVILLDRCWTVALNVNGGGFTAGTGYARDVVRLDSSWSTSDARGPSIRLNVEGQNWFNPAWTNIIHDTNTGEVIPVSAYGDYAYPEVFWGRKLILGGGASIPNVTIPGATGPVPTTDMLPWHHFMTLGVPNAPLTYGGGVANYATDNHFWTGLLGYEQTASSAAGLGWYVPLSKGTWDLTWWGLSGTNRGIAQLDISFDNGATWINIGSQDQYNVAVVGVLTSIFQGIVVPNHARAILRLTQPTKNASSSGYGTTFLAMSWNRTV